MTFAGAAEVVAAAEPRSSLEAVHLGNDARRVGQPVGSGANPICNGGATQRILRGEPWHGHGFLLFGVTVSGGNRAPFRDQERELLGHVHPREVLLGHVGGAIAVAVDALNDPVRATLARGALPSRLAQHCVRTAWP
jgi:hypothetical protein